MGSVNLCTVNPYPIFLHRGQLGDHTIAGKPADKEYGTLRLDDLLIPVIDHMGIEEGDVRQHIEVITGESIAADFVLHHGHHGIFLPANGQTPTEGELSDARKKMEDTFVQAVREADTSWNMKRNRLIISETARRAAKYLKLTGIEWADMDTIDSAYKSCKFCGEKILAVAIKCKVCGSMLNAPTAPQPDRDIPKQPTSRA